MVPQTLKSFLSLVVFFFKINRRIEQIDQHFPAKKVPFRLSHEYIKIM